MVGEGSEFGQEVGGNFGDNDINQVNFVDNVVVVEVWRYKMKLLHCYIFFNFLRLKLKL